LLLFLIIEQVTFHSITYDKYSGGPRKESWFLDREELKESRNKTQK
jgi:hypothetical protein